MTAHDRETLTVGCYRCALNWDEMNDERLSHLRVAKLLRRVAASPRRRPGTRGLLLDLADELSERADEIASSIGTENFA